MTREELVIGVIRAIREIPGDEAADKAVSLVREFERATLERAMRATCPGCEAGEPVRRMDNGQWRHTDPRTVSFCMFIRALIGKE